LFQTEAGRGGETGKVVNYLLKETGPHTKKPTLPPNPNPPL
jgi:hypothetical protein